MPLNSSRISSRVGVGFSVSNATALIMNPGEQNAHWNDIASYIAR